MSGNYMRDLQRCKVASVDFRYNAVILCTVTVASNHNTNPNIILISPVEAERLTHPLQYSVVVTPRKPP